MAFANYRKKSAQMAHMKAQQNKQEPGCMQAPDFGASQMTSFFEEENKNLTKKWSCDEDGVTINTKWFPTTRVRTFSLSGSDFLPGNRK